MHEKYMKLALELAEKGRGKVNPNPLVSGMGVQKLIDAGIEVTTGVLEKECRQLNEIFMKYIVERKPFVIMKTAMSLDGKIATKTGESKWITSPESRNNVHHLRSQVAGIMVGVNTIIMDNPELTCRIENGNNPIRIIVDSRLRIPIDSKVLDNQHMAKTIIATTSQADIRKKNEIENKGVKVLITESLEGKVDLQDLMSKLATENIDSLLLEGGSTLNFSALKQSIVDKIQVYIAPKIIGGEKSSTLTISASLVLETTVIGDSICTNGVCLTVTKINNNSFEADIMAETLRRSNLGVLKDSDFLVDNVLEIKQVIEKLNKEPSESKQLYKITK